MDPIFFRAKRAYYATLRYSRAQLSAFGLTPARLDLLRCLFDAFQRALAQSRLRQMLEVARSTLTRMLRALEDLGLVERSQCKFDHRTLWCKLTTMGYELVRRALRALILTKRVEHAVDDAFVSKQQPNAREERLVAGSVFRRLRAAFAPEVGRPQFVGAEDNEWQLTGYDPLARLLADEAPA